MVRWENERIVTAIQTCKIQVGPRKAGVFSEKSDSNGNTSSSWLLVCARVIKGTVNNLDGRSAAADAASYGGQRKRKKNSNKKGTGYEISQARGTNCPSLTTERATTCVRVFASGLHRRSCSVHTAAEPSSCMYKHCCL